MCLTSKNNFSVALENFKHQNPPKPHPYINPASPETEKTTRAPAESFWKFPNSHLTPFRPCQRLEEAFPPPHHHRRLDHINPPWEAPLRHLFRTRPFPHLRGEPLLSADTPLGGHPLNLCHLPTKLRGLFLGPLRREPSSRVLESHPMLLRQSRL